jgi:hypothetical protein
MQQRILERFEEKLQGDLLRLCTSYGMLGGTLLATDDINDLWHNTLAPEYMADAVTQIQDYPTVSVAWAAYLGMAVADGWDKNWDKCKKTEYKSYYGSDGFDDMDEHIIRDVIGLSLESDEAKGIEMLIRRMAQTSISLIRHEQIEPQSPMAFHVFARAVKVMFRMGAALQLKRLGYKFERMELN